MTTDSQPVWIVSGPSGSGKSTLVKKLLELPNMMLSVSCTTRRPRMTESEGKWYNFISEAEFQRMVSAGEFLEYAQVFGKNWYGTPRKAVDDARNQKKELVLEIDVQGALQVKEKLPWARAIFVLPPSRADLEKRIRARGQDSEDEICRRLHQAHQEILNYHRYDYVIVNDDLDRAGREVQSIALGERSRVARNEEIIQGILKSFGG